MAIAFDSSASGGSTTGTSLSWNHTCTGSNLALFVQTYDVGNSITGITYNGVALTKIAGPVQDGSNNNFTTLWMLLAPATGTHSIVISLSGSVFIQANSASYTGVKQSGQPDASATNASAGATSLATSVTTILDNCWVLAIGTIDNGTFSSVTNCTTRQSGGGSFFTDSNGPKTPAGSFTATANCASTSNIGMIVASIAPVIDFGVSWMPDCPSILLDTLVETVDSGFNPRPPQNPFDPTPN